MNLAQLLSSLFNLGAETGFWNSDAAARDFWILFAVVAAMLIATVAARSTNHHRRPHLRH
jgi:hypothetical protein